MIGVVGNIKIQYMMDGKEFSEVVDIQNTAEFSLHQCDLVRFRVEEITYIEDTIYGVVLSLIEPHYEEDKYLISSDNEVDFVIDEYHIRGSITLCY